MVIDPNSELMVLGVEEIYDLGVDICLESMSVNGEFGVVFEDNEETGYFYAILLKPEMYVVDALHIYDVINVIDKDKPCKLQIAWTDDGAIASLLINGYCYALFDFSNRAGYCRNGFPENQSGWALVPDRKLTEEKLLSLFRDRC